MKPYEEHDVITITRLCVATDKDSDKTMKIPAGTRGTIISVLKDGWYTIEFNLCNSMMPIIMDIHAADFKA